MKVPYKEYRKIKSKQQLEDYIKKIENGLLIYGEPNYTKSPFNNEDALLIARNEKGELHELMFEYFMTPEGHRYRLNENKDGTFKKIYMSENKGGVYKLTLKNGETKLFRVHHLQLWSYYSDLDWKPFCKNLKGNLRRRRGNNDATVDHIKQEHKACHYKYLEAVPQSENSRRSGLFNDKERALRQAQSKGKSFIVKMDGKQIGGEFHSTRKAVEYLSETLKINVSPARISNCLNGKRKTVYKKRLTFEYTKEHSNSQKDLDDEIWKTLEEWCQKEGIINRYKKIEGRIPPKAISNKGRIMTNFGKITNGSQEEGSNHSRFNCVDLSMLVWEAFSVKVIGDKFLLHDDKHRSNTFDKKTGKVIRYSNWFETLRLGTHKENMEDKSRENKRLAELYPENEFIVCDKKGVEVMRSFYIPHCVKELKEKIRGKNFDAGSIDKCLKKILKTHQGFTFTHVLEK
tara:strand:- start:15832 stop:17208 length:1377 start_codon:yes stop_codon:yes gene_type:complete